MIAEKLRKAVLQAAIQGKLTQQLPEDGDARDLLKQIRQEKEQLVKEGKLRKGKSLLPISEEELPFEIPQNWVWARLLDVILNNIGGGTPSKSIPEYWKKEVPWASVKDLNGMYLDTTQDMISHMGLDNSSSNLIPSGNVIVCTRMGLGKASINRIAVAINQDLRALHLPDCMDAHYVLYYYSTLMFEGKGATVKGISIDELNNSLVPVPPTDEQRRIAHQINLLNSNIDILKEHEQELEQLYSAFPNQIKNAILQHAMEGKLTDQRPEDGNTSDLMEIICNEKAQLIKEGKLRKQKPLPAIVEEEVPFDIPENWCWVRLGDVTDYGVGKQTNPKSIGLGSWVLELEDIEKESFVLLSRRKDRKPGSSKNRFEKNDVLYGKLRPYLKKVIVADDQGFCSTEIIPFRGYAGISSEYLKFCMVSPSINNFINSVTHGMDMPRLGTEKAINLTIPLPPLAEQHRIVKRLEELLPLCESLE